MVSLEEKPISTLWENLNETVRKTISKPDESEIYKKFFDIGKVISVSGSFENLPESDRLNAFKTIAELELMYHNRASLGALDRSMVESMYSLVNNFFSKNNKALTEYISWKKSLDQ